MRVCLYFFPWPLQRFVQIVRVCVRACLRLQTVLSNMSFGWMRYMCRIFPKLTIPYAIRGIQVLHLKVIVERKTSAGYLWQPLAQQRMHAKTKQKILKKQNRWIHRKLFRIYSKNHSPVWVWNIDPFLAQPRNLQVGEVVLESAFVATIAMSRVPQQNTSGHYSTHSYYRRYSGIVGKGIFYTIWVGKPEWYRR